MSNFIYTNAPDKRPFLPQILLQKINIIWVLLEIFFKMGFEVSQDQGVDYIRSDIATEDSHF